MYTAKLKKEGLQYSDYSIYLMFYGKGYEILNKLQDLTESYKYKKNKFEIELLNIQKDSLNQQINSLTYSKATIKKHNKFYAFNKELRNKIYDLNKDIENIKLKIKSIDWTIETLMNFCCYKSEQLLDKYNTMLTNLGFVLTSSTKDGNKTTEMYTFEGDEDEMLKKAEQMYEKLATSLQQECEIMKKDYYAKNSHTREEELTC